MRIEGDYEKDGYAFLRGLPPELAAMLFKQIQTGGEFQRHAFDEERLCSELWRVRNLDV